MAQSIRCCEPVLGSQPVLWEPAESSAVAVIARKLSETSFSNATLLRGRSCLEEQRTFMLV